VPAQLCDLPDNDVTVRRGGSPFDNPPERKGVSRMSTPYPPEQQPQEAPMAMPVGTPEYVVNVDEAPPATEPILPKPKRILGMPVVGFVILLAIVLAAAFGTWMIFKPKPFTLVGSITLTDDRSVSALYNQDGCHGTGGYSDIAEGAPVTVYNADGRIVSTGTISYSTGLSSTSCYLGFTAFDVPGGQGPYQYEVSHRGRLTFTEDQGRDGSVSATLGDK
jgi:hypothetical protein